MKNEGQNENRSILERLLECQMVHVQGLIHQNRRWCQFSTQRRRRTERAGYDPSFIIWTPLDLDLYKTFCDIPEKSEKSMDIFQRHPGDLQFQGSVKLCRLSLGFQRIWWCASNCTDFPALIPQPGANGDATRVAGQQWSYGNISAIDDISRMRSALM